MIHIDRSKPIYPQVIEFIKMMIVRGDVKPGDRLPTVRELAHRLNINPNTVAKAYYHLEREGILKARVGDGTFVVDDRERIERERRSIVLNIIRDFKRTVESYGMSLKDIKKLLEEVWKE